MPAIIDTDTESDTSTETTNATELSPAIAAMANQQFKIPGDQIAKALQPFSDGVREAFKWLAGYQRKHNLSCADIGAKLRNKRGESYSGDAISAVYYGRRTEPEVRHLVKEIDRFRKVSDEREGLTDTGFIETSLSQAIWRTCERSFLRQRLTFIFGESQIGKTTALLEYQRKHNHGETLYVRMPTRGSMGDFLEELAIMLGIPTQQKHRELRRRIMDSFDERNLLIVDEAHQCLSSHYSSRAIGSLEFCREIHDKRRCGMVICGTNVLKDGILRGPHSRMLRQLWLRSHAPLYLPHVPTEKQLAEFARAFKLPPAGDTNNTVEWENEWGQSRTTRENQKTLQNRVIIEHGLGRWLSILQEAADDARAASTRITWGRVIAAHARFQEMEQVVEDAA